MNEKVAALIQKSQQERKRAEFGRALKRLEQAIAAHPDELDLYLEAIDTALDGGELLSATNLLKTVQEKFTRERERVLGFVREKLQTVHDPSLARCVVEHAVKRRELEGALALLDDVPDHTIRELLNRARTKAQSLKSASHGGYTVRGEAVTNELTNAVLSVRLGNIKESMATFVKVVEEKPVEHKGLAPFLAAIAARHPKSGRVRHAMGCALLAGGNEIDAISHFVEGARIEPACAASCAAQLQAMIEKSHHPGKVRRALAETQLLKGDIDDAAQTLREYLAENPENAREVIMLLRPFIDPGTGLHACTWLAVEQALAIEQSSVALEILRSLHQRGNHGTELYQWLEERSEAGALPSDVRQFHGTLALEQKQFERAAAIFSDICSASPQDVQIVLSAIDRHRSSHPALEDLYRKHAPEDKPSDESGASDDGDFQMFEANEFRIPGGGAAPASPRPVEEKPKPRFSTSPFSSTGNDAKAAKDKPETRKSFIESTELSFDDDGAIKREERDEPIDDDGAVNREDGDEPMKTDEPNEITESHVTSVGQELYAAGAAAFFHIDGGTESAAAESPADAHRTVEPEPAKAAPGPAAPAPAIPADEPFIARFEKFSRGELSNTVVLALLEEAARDGHVDELRELLHFEPETGAEHFARYYYQAEYHVLCNRPLQALEILSKLDIPGIGNEEKLRIWYKIAVAQRMTQNYAGAATTLDRLVEHFPDRKDLVRLQRRNQEQFLDGQSMVATILEKTSSLD